MLLVIWNCSNDNLQIFVSYDRDNIFEAILVNKIITQVFSDMDFLGWYSTGDSPGVQEITVHQQISDINESPLFLQVNSPSEYFITVGLYLK